VAAKLAIGHSPNFMFYHMRKRAKKGR
jgi:hypothetical protein